MKKILSIILMVLISFSSSFVSAESVNIQCTYDYISTPEFNKFYENLGTFLKQHYKIKKWWEFWIRKKQMNISFDLDKKMVTFGTQEDMPSGSNYTVNIYPDAFSITAYWYNQQIESKYSINRISGIFFGSIYDPDGTLGFKPNSLSIYGECKSLQSLF